MDLDMFLYSDVNLNDDSAVAKSFTIRWRSTV